MKFLSWLRVLLARLGVRRRRGLAVLVPPSIAEVERRLFDRLWKRAKRDRLPIFVQPEDRMVLQGNVCAGQYHRSAVYHVRIHEAYREDPWTLAHEMGHRELSRGGRPQHAERDADCAARRIVLALLLPHEAAAVRGVMDKNFDGSGTVEDRRRK